ncbi:MAG: hypothetical protein ACLP5H_17600, partial [Desulfomonilaceae bacterium]
HCERSEAIFRIGKWRLLRPFTPLNDIFLEKPCPHTATGQALIPSPILDHWPIAPKNGAWGQGFGLAFNGFLRQL